jgi:hypothetical protein
VFRQVQEKINRPQPPLAEFSLAKISHPLALNTSRTPLAALLATPHCHTGIYLCGFPIRFWQVIKKKESKKRKKGNNKREVKKTKTKKKGTGQFGGLPGLTRAAFPWVGHDLASATRHTFPSSAHGFSRVVPHTLPPSTEPFFSFASLALRFCTHFQQRLIVCSTIIQLCIIV